MAAFAFDRLKDLDELAIAIDVGSGVRTVAQRQAAAQVNLGLASGTPSAPPAPGVVTANQAVIAGANKNVDTLEIDALNVGASGTPGTLKVFATTASKGDLKIVAPDNTGNTETTLTTASYGQATVLTVPDPAAATAKVLLDTATVPATFAAGTASAAPVKLTAGTNLTVPAAGALEYDGTAFYATAVASARQQLDAEQYTIASADSATYNNTGLDTNAAAQVFTTTMGGSANGAVALVAGKTYAFEGLYNLTNTGTTSHTWGANFGGTATFTKGNVSVFGASGVTAGTPISGGLFGFLNSTTLSTNVVATAASVSATEQVAVRVTGTIIVNASGTLIPQMQASARPGASGTPGVVVKAGSYFRIWEMAGAGSVGNWT